MDSLGVYLSPEYLLNFCQTCILHHVLGKFFIRLLKNAKFKILNLFIFNNFPKQYSPRFLSSPPGWRKLTIPPRQHFSKFYPPAETEEGQKTMELKKWPKLNLWEYWQQFLLNPTIFTSFTFLVSVLLCHNLDSSLLKFPYLK